MSAYSEWLSLSWNGFHVIPVAVSWAPLLTSRAVNYVRLLLLHFQNHPTCTVIEISLCKSFSLDQHLLYDGMSIFQGVLDIEVSAFQGVHIGGLHCIVEKCPLIIEVSAFQGVHIEGLHCIVEKCPQHRGVCISHWKRSCRASRLKGYMHWDTIICISGVDPHWGVPWYSPSYTILHGSRCRAWWQA